MARVANLFADSFLFVLLGLGLRHFGLVDGAPLGVLLLALRLARLLLLLLLLLLPLARLLALQLLALPLLAPLALLEGARPRVILTPARHLLKLSPQIGRFCRT